MVLPMASGLANWRAARIAGKFHGDITDTTPTGRRIATENLPCSDGSTSPKGWWQTAAAARSTSGT
jgi:hypothetical protein